MLTQNRQISSSSHWTGWVLSSPSWLSVRNFYLLVIDHVLLADSTTLVAQHTFDVLGGVQYLVW